MSIDTITVDSPCRFVPQNAAQQSVLSQLMTLQAELRDIDETGQALFRHLARRSDEPRSEVLARAFISSRSNPFVAHERYRRVVQNQYWKLVKLFHQLADADADDTIDESIIDEPTIDEPTDDSANIDQARLLSTRLAGCDRANEHNPPHAQQANKPTKSQGLASVRTQTNPFIRDIRPISPIRAIKEDKTNPLLHACREVAASLIGTDLPPPGSVK